MPSDQPRTYGNPLSESKSGSSLLDEVTRWFFDDYLAIWVGVGSGAIARGSEFILDYWGVPLHYCSPDGGDWLLDGDSVVGLLAHTHSRLRAQGYSYTAVPDRKVTIYHRSGAAIDVIWSRCRADDNEIERFAVHFEVARGSAGWRVVGIQEAPTRADSLKPAWGRAT
jgi:uncharacterized NTF2-like protein DUF6841